MPQRRSTDPSCTRQHDAGDDLEDFESWEDYVELYEQQDYAALVAHCEAELERDPEDSYAVYRLADAYVLNGQPERALAMIAPHYRQMPDSFDFQWVILDALFAMGRSEHDFAWIGPPPRIHRLDEDLCRLLCDLMRRRRKQWTVDDLTTHLICKGHYVAFENEDLTELLRGDPRFVVQSGSTWPQVRLASRRQRNSRSRSAG